MEDKDLLQANPITTSVETTIDPGYAAFEKWANTRTGNYGLPETPELGTFQVSNGGGGGGRVTKAAPNRLAQLADEANANTEDTSRFSYRTKDVSKRYPLNYLGINNEQLYAENQSTMQKAYNGVVKMAGTAGTTFVNGTAGTVYGILESAKTGKLSSFYNNDLTNYLNDINVEMEDTYAHYKTERELKGDWWEPSNLFTANFLFDNVIKNLGYSIGAVGAGFAWGAALKAIGLTGRLMATGEKWAGAADAAIGEATTLAETERLVAATSKLEGLWGQAKSQIGKGLMSTDRSIVATFGTFGEAGMEALHNSQEFRNTMISNFKSKYGYDPDGKDLDQINQYAESVGNWTFGLNTALLTATNYIQLPKIYSSSFKGEKQILNGVVREGERYVQTLPEKGFGKLLYKAKNVASLGFNTAEAFEEGAQFAVQTGTQHYFNRKYNNQDASALSDGLLYGVKEALTSSEGTLNIFIGGVSGALQSSGVVGVKGYMPTIGQTGKIGERGWTGYGGEQAALRNEAISALNNTMIKTKLKDAHSNIIAAESIQKDRTAAIRRGDILESKDLEFDYAHSFIATRLKYNAKEAINSEIESLKQEAMMEGGFQKLQQEELVAPTDTRESFLNRLNNLQEHANNAAKLQEAIDIKYKGLVDDNGKPLYSQVVLDKLVYAGSKVMDYNTRIPQVNSNLIKSGITNTQEIIDEILKTGELNSELYNEAVSKIDALTGITSDESASLKRDLEDLGELSLRKKMFLDEYDAIKNNPKDYTEGASLSVDEEGVVTDEYGNVVPEDQVVTNEEGVKIDSEGKPIPSNTVVVKTKSGDRNIKLNTEYFLGRVIDYSAKGSEVYRTPKLTVLGINEDGTIKIRTSVGTIRNISKEEFEDYNLVEVSKAKANKKLNYYMEHWNTMYEHYGRKNKDGSPAVGRLEYNDKDRTLTFVYTRNGVIKREEVTGDQWNEALVAKKGYKHGIIRPIGELTAAQQKAEEEFIEDAKTDPRVEAKRAARLQILNDLFDELSKRQDKSKKLIEQKQKTLENITKEIADLQKQIEDDAKVDKRYKKGIRFNSTTRKALDNAMKLSRMQSQLEEELKALESDLEEVEYNMDYISNVAANIDETATNFYDFKNELEEELLDLEILREQTAKQISTVTKLIDQVQKAIDYIIEMLSDLITKFEAKYPNVPKMMGQDWVDFLQTNPNFLKLKPEYKNDLQDLNEAIAFHEDGDITPSEKRIADLKEHLDIMEEEFKDLSKQIDAKYTILNKFADIAKQYEEQQAQNDRMQRNEELKNSFIGVMTNAVQNFFGTAPYEAASKKTNTQVVTSTRPKNTGVPHQDRANYFGNKFNTFRNKNKIKAVIVTPTTEVGFIDGLTNHFLSDVSDPKKFAKAKQEAIFLVMVDEDGRPVDKEGQTIPEGADIVNNAIYQVFPSSELKGNYLGQDGKWVETSMFREGIDPQEEAFLREKYTQWRNDQLSQTTIGDPLSFTPSFGIPELVKKWDDTIKNADGSVGAFVTDKNARVSAQAAGLITQSNLNQNQVVEIPTTGESVEENSVTFESPKGRVFLRIPGVGMAKLFNRRFNQKEANTIFDVMLQITKSGASTGTLTPETNKLFDWLKSVSYWGIAKYPDGKRKEAGYNNLWFEKDVDGVQKLFISGLNKDSKQAFDFTPAGLMNRKDDIIFLLQQLYNNTDASMVNNEDTWNNPYTEITGINADGSPSTVKWPNYQTYLLSDKAPDSEGNLTVKRSDKELPLATQFRPITEAQPTNREAVYFKLNDVSEFGSYIKKEAPVAQEVAPVTAVTQPIVGTQTEIKPATSTPAVKQQEFNLQGGENVSTSKSGKSLYFTINKDRSGKYKVTIDSVKSNDYISAMSAATNSSAIDTIVKLTELYEQQIASQVVAESIPVQPAIVDKPSEEAPVAKKDRPKATPVDRSANYRLQRIKVAEQFQKEDWGKVEDFIKKNFPNIPFYRVKNMIQATNGRQAWGMLHDGAIYVAEGAEIGTAYHEVFEGVWKMFAGPAEKQKIIDEFRNRQGSYEDRFTGKTIKYSEATDAELKEEIAEEFRDFVLTGKQVIRKEGTNLISRLFNELVAFIKEFFTGKKAINNTQKLFDQIGNGYYAKYNPYVSNLAYAKAGIIDIENATGDDSSELRVNNIPEMQLHDIVQQMTYSTLADLSKTNKSLFAIEKINKADLYKRLKAEVLNLVNWEMELLTQGVANNLDTLYDNIELEWDNIVKEHAIQLKSYNVEFDENDDTILTSDENTGKGEFDSADKIDSFKKANAAIKMMLATLPEMELVDGKLQYKPSTIGGRTLMAADKVYVDLVSNLHKALNIDDMFNQLAELAKSNPNYALLYERMVKSPVAKQVNYNNVQEHDFHLMAAFYKAMKKQNADVITVFILPTGEVVVSNSTLNNAAKQAKREMINTISSTLKKDLSTFFKYNKEEYKYYATDIVKDYKLSAKDLDGYVAFLNNIGIDFKLNDVQNKLNGVQLKVFRKAVEGIQQSFSTIGDDITVKANIRDEDGNLVKTNSAISIVNSKTLDIDKRLSQLGIIKAILSNPEFESTYFNINGEKSQNYIGTNVVSDLYDVISKLDNIYDLDKTPYHYLLTDNFVKGSVMLNKMFDVEGDGGRRDGTEELLNPTIIDGTVNEDSGKKKQSSKQSYRDRLIQEINLNLSGRYANLVPGDASLEYAIKMHEEGSPFVKEAEYTDKSYLSIFKDYFLSEVELSREDRHIPNVKGRSNKDLRFFKSILGDVLHKEIVSSINKTTVSTELYKKYESKINSAIEAFIKNEAQDTKQLLKSFNIIEYTENGLEANGLLLGENKELTEDIINDELNLLSLNYIIANIEMHKLIYSDPYQYKDELKRVKNFNSPGQPLVSNSGKVNSALDRLYNEDKGYVKGDIGWTDMLRDHFRTITMEDTLSVSDLPGYDDPYEETDGGGYITMRGNRVFKLRDGSWTEANERQYIYDVAYEKLDKKLALTDLEKEIFEAGNPEVKDTYTPIKPIVRGSKANGRNYNDIVLHKFALVPLSYRILHEINPTSNAIKLYNKMQAEDIDYAVYASGSKVGTEKVSSLYKDGKFDTTPFETQAEKDGLLKSNELRGVNKIPFSIVAVQSEVPSKDTPLVTQGSQITKLVTMDFMEAGVPTDFEVKDAKGNIIEDFDERFAAWIAIKDEADKEASSELYKEIKNNQTLLEARIEEGYNTLLKKLGITESVDAKGKKLFNISDKVKLVNTLRDEILKRESNYNILDAFDGFEKGDVILEATPAYQQIRNILYSIADKNVVRPKISGGMKVQIPANLLETNRVTPTVVDGKTVYTAGPNDLRFYSRKEDGKTINVCQIMVGRWFKSDKTDAELMEYFNNTEEGKKELAALTGVAYRIPTQKQNSIDVFEIGKFLPKEFGDSVVIPSALVKKVGSDFDIDKLSIYLKSLYEDVDGKLKVVPFYGIGQEAKYKFEDLFYDKLDAKIDRKNAQLVSKEKLQTIFGEIAYGESSDKQRNKWVPIFKEMFADSLVDDKLSIDVVEDFFIRKIENLGKSLTKLTDVDLQTILAEQFTDDMYRKSLENQYIQSLENLVSHPSNFDNLIKPNDATELRELSEKIQKQMGNSKVDYSSVGNMLNRRFMSSLRQAFVTGKYAIGIAAVGQTGHSQRQRTATYIDIDRMASDKISDTDKKWLGGNANSPTFARDSNINFQEYNSAIIDGKRRPMLSFIKNKAGQFISDINGMFIDGYVDISKGPWIMDLGATPNVTSTWLFLVDLGVPMDTIGYFMNQPIIKDYLRAVENKGYSWLFIDSILEDTLAAYAPKKEIEVKGIPSEADLFKMLAYNKADIKSSMDDVQKVQQQYMLKEFLKYAKMSSHVFQVTQGSNFDTANINDPYLVFKKSMQLKQAQNTIISSVDDILNSSFVGLLKDIVYDFRNAFSEILLSDKPSVRKVMEEVLTPYINLSDRDFVKTSQKAVNDLFDWAVQTSPSFGQNISSILLGTDTEKSAAEQIMDYRDSILGNAAKGIAPKPEHPLFNNVILNSLKDEGTKQGKVTNLYLAGRDSKVYDQNLTIYGFNELRKHLSSENKNLYTKLVRLAVLQSGLTNSKIAFTNLLPYNDFKDVYNETLSNLENLPNLAKFSELNVFERNNWSNTDIVPFKKAKMRKDAYENWYFPELKLDGSLKDAVNTKKIPKVISISPYSSEGRADFITYSWDSYVSKEERARRRKVGDYSHVNRALMQKVYTTNEKGDRVPLIQRNTAKNGTVYESYIYKAINAWGDSFKANEFYSTAQQSVLDNDYTKVDEVSDNVVANILLGMDHPMKPTETVSEKPEDVPQKDNTNKTSVEGMNERLYDYGFTDLVIPSNYFEGTRPTGRLNSFKDSIKQVSNNLQILKNLNLSEFDFLSADDKQRLDALRPKVEEFIKLNIAISSSETRTVGAEKRYAQLSNEILNEFVDVIGKHVEQQLGKIIVTSNPIGISKKEWDGLSQEEKNKIKEC